MSATKPRLWVYGSLAGVAIVVMMGGAASTIQADPPRPRAWPLWLGLALIAWGVIAFAWVLRQRAQAKDRRALCLLLGALTLSPCIIAVGAAMAGAPIWILGVALGASSALAVFTLRDSTS